MRKQRTLAMLLVLGGAAALGWYNYGRAEAATAPDTVTVGRGTVEETALASGSLQASAIVSVGARRADIMRQFLIEAVLACCVGGAAARLDPIAALARE